MNCEIVRSPPIVWIMGLAVTFMVLTFGITIDGVFAQTMDITATDSIDDTSSLVLDNAVGITSFVINSKTYVAVASYDDDGVQIIDVTDPSNITATDSIADTTSLELNGAWGITSFVINSKTYVAVTGYDDDGVQIIDVTDPTDISATDSIADTRSLELRGPWGITSFVINSKTYVAVTGNFDDGVQIIDVTDPTDISATDSIGDTSSLVLNEATGITSFVINNKTYVAVTGYADDGVQIIDVTDPSNIAVTDSIDDMDGTLELNGAQGITSFVINSKTYVAVTGDLDDGVQILKLNQAPTAKTGANHRVVAGTLVTLRSAGSDADGDTISYSWTVPASSSVTLSSNTAQNPTFTAPVSAGRITFTVTVSDGTLSDSDTITITIVSNQPPTANAGSDQNVAVGASVTLDGTGSSDPDSNTLTYSWAKTSGPAVSLNGDMTAQPTFTAPSSPGVIVFTLGVTDEITTVTDTVTVTVSAGLIANAGQDQNVTTGEVVTLDGTNSANTVGSTLTYSWVKTSGPAVSLNGHTTAQPTFTAPSSPGVIVFTLTVSDGTSVKTDTVTITVSAPPNQPPTANAGSNQSVASGTLVTLSGSGSDPDGDTLSYSWATPAGSSVTLSNTSAQNPTFTAPSSAGTITFTLTVSDGTLSATDTVTITVSVIPNQPPTANAGRDRTFPLGSTVTLSGSGSDPDGNDNNLIYTWEQTSGTPTVIINDPGSAQTTFTAPSEQLVFTLTISDGTDSVTDSITITLTGPNIETQTRNNKDIEDVLVSAKITASNQITMTYNKELSTFINSYLNFTITGEDTPRNITGIDGSPSKSETVNIDGEDVDAYLTILTFNGEPVPAGSTGSMYIQHADHYLAFIQVSDGQN